MFTYHWTFDSNSIVDWLLRYVSTHSLTFIFFLILYRCFLVLEDIKDISQRISFSLCILIIVFMVQKSCIVYVMKFLKDHYNGVPKLDASVFRCVITDS